MRVVGCTKLMLYMEPITKLFDILVLKRPSIISDNGERDFIMINDIIEDKRGNMFTSDSHESDGFNPLCKILSGGYDEFVEITRWMDLSHKVESPLKKRPRRC